MANAPEREQVTRVVKIVNLRSNPLQPPIRTTDKAMRELRSAHARSGVILPLVAVDTGRSDGDLTLVDGERRKLLAVEKGKTEVAVTVLSGGDIVRDFLDLNRGMRIVGNKDTFQSWAMQKTILERERVLKRMASGARQNIKYLIETVGYDWTVSLGLEGRVSSNIAKQIKEYINKASEFRIAIEPVVAADWILELSLQRWVRESGRGSFTERRSFSKDVEQMRLGQPPACVAGQVKIRSGIPRLAAKRQLYVQRLQKLLQKKA